MLAPKPAVTSPGESAVPLPPGPDGPPRKTVTAPGPLPEATARSMKPSPLTSPAEATASPNNASPLNVSLGVNPGPFGEPLKTDTLCDPAWGEPMATSANPSPLKSGTTPQAMSPPV